MWDAVQKICGTVKWVDNPQWVVWIGAVNMAAFLHNEPPFWTGFL